MDALEIIRIGMDNSKRGTERALEGLTAEELKWQPRPDANSIGLIYFHMARSEDSFVMTLIQGKKQLWETAKWYQKMGKAVDDQGSHYTAEQVAGFAVPDMKDMRAYTDAVRAQTLDYLKGLKPKDLDARVEFPPDRRPPFEPVVGILLTLNVTHLAQHAGEISYIRGLKRGIDKKAE